MFDLDPLAFSDIKSNAYCAVFLSYVDGSPSEQQGASGANTEILFCSKESLARKTVLILFQDEDEIRLFEYEPEWKTVIHCKLENEKWKIDVKLGDN